MLTLMFCAFSRISHAKDFEGGTAPEQKVKIESETYPGDDESLDPQEFRHKNIWYIGFIYVELVWWNYLRA